MGTGGETQDPPLNWKSCSSEEGLCAFVGETEVRFGAGASWITAIVQGGIPCTRQAFGKDPAPGIKKVCEIAEGVDLAQFKHPGILHTSEQLADIKGKLDRGPWRLAYQKMEKDSIASLDYEFTPYAVVECGFYNEPNIGCSEINRDARAAYSLALRFVLSDNEEYAEKSRTILDAWAQVYEKNTDKNSNLVVAWAAPFFANAGELLRHYDPDWSAENTDSLGALLKKFLPYVKVETHRVNNWVHSKIEAQMAIAIFLDDKAEFDEAIARWKKWVPYYIYQESDGSEPLMVEGRNLFSTWSQPKTFVEGMTMETCRDLAHMGDLGFASLFYGGQYAWHQGVDLFVVHKKRFIDALNLHGPWMTGEEAVPMNLCESGKVLARLKDTEGIKPPEGGGRETWEIAYNHFHTRFGESIPSVREMIDEERPSGGQGSSGWARKWETLTLGDQTSFYPYEVNQ